MTGDADHGLQPHARRPTAAPADILDTFDPERQRIYNSYSIRVQRAAGRPGPNLFGGLSVERQLNVNCTPPDNPNSPRFCDERHLEDGFRFRSGRICGWPARSRCRTASR